MINFYYGTMKSGKSDLLIDLFNKQSGTRYACIPKSLAINGKTRITSRSGKEIDSVYTLEKVNALVFSSEKFSVFLDEAQFISYKEYETIKNFAKNKNIDVYIFSLKKDFKNRKFSFFDRFYEISDKQTQLFCLCEECNKEKALFNIRFFKDKPIIEGEVFCMESDKIKYKVLCKKCAYALLHINNP